MYGGGGIDANTDGGWIVHRLTKRCQYGIVVSGSDINKRISVASVYRFNALR